MVLRSIVRIPERVYHDIRNYFIPKAVDSERVAFIFAAVSKTNDSIRLQFREWYPVKPDEYEYQSLWYVELKDEMCPKVIKMAFDLDASIVELHSHPYSRPAGFSFSDLAGFDEFVPHVWWRLKGKPYAAIVFSHSDFDALIWIDDPRTPQQLTEIIVGEEHLYPNGLTLSNRGQAYDYRSF